MERQLLTDKAYNLLKNRIIDLQLRPGEILLVHTLATAIGLSRTPVREALIRLKEEGLVEETQARKFRVTQITLTSIMELYEIREIIECKALRFVATHRTNEQLEYLSELDHTMVSALKSGDYDKFFDSDQQLHNAIVSYYGNQTLSDLLKGLSDSNQRIRYLTMSLDERIQHSIDEHGRIIEAIRRKDAPGAVKTLKLHFKNARKDMRDLYDQRNSPLGRILRLHDEPKPSARARTTAASARKGGRT